MKNFFCILRKLFCTKVKLTREYVEMMVSMYIYVVLFILLVWHIECM